MAEGLRSLGFVASRSGAVSLLLRAFDLHFSLAAQRAVPDPFVSYAAVVLSPWFACLLWLGSVALLSESCCGADWRYGFAAAVPGLFESRRLAASLLVFASRF